jgi:hypothetical protein
MAEFTENITKEDRGKRQAREALGQGTDTIRPRHAARVTENALISATREPAAQGRLANMMYALRSGSTRAAELIMGTETTIY